MIKRVVNGCGRCDCCRKLVCGNTFSVGWAPTLSQYFTRSKFKTTCFVALPSGKGSYLRWKVHEM